MIREEAKELSPVLKAWAEGRIIQFRKKGTSEWVDFYEDDLRVSSAYYYRIKPEPKYRPFVTKEECWNEMLKHQPFGWLIDKDGDYLLPATVDDETDFISRFRVLKFADGTPFGIKEEE